jgi:hypothetical protein
MIIGIFTTWDWSFMDKPESRLKKQLQKNPTHPFREIEPNVFVTKLDKSIKITIGVILSTLTAITSTIIYWHIGSVNEYIVVPLIIISGFLFTALYHLKEHSCVLDCNNKIYEYYRGDRLVYRGHFHNIYIRLKGQLTGNGQMYYTLIMNGYQLDEEELTSSSPIHDKLAKFGRKLAHRLDLNYFEYNDRSRYHIIRQQCPYRDRLDPLGGGKQPGGRLSVLP